MGLMDHLPLIIIAILGLVMVVTVIVQNSEPAIVYGFEDVFNEVSKLDQKYATDFRQEELAHYMILRANIDDYQKDLQSLKLKVQNNTKIEETKYINNFFDARENMLESQKQFYNALSFGRYGGFFGPESCYNLDKLESATDMYNESIKYGGRAMRDLDLTLRLKSSRPLVGIGTENRPKFYSKIFENISVLMNTNKKAIDEFCPAFLKSKELNNADSIAS